jgi:hypothetical protein
MILCLLQRSREPVKSLATETSKKLSLYDPVCVLANVNLTAGKGVECSCVCVKLRLILRVNKPAAL